MDMFVGNRWQGSPEWIDVVAPYTREVIDRVPAATPEQPHCPDGEQRLRPPLIAAIERDQQLRDVKLIAEGAQGLSLIETSSASRSGVTVWAVTRSTSGSAVCSKVKSTWLRFQ